MASVSLGRHGLAEIATLRPRGSIFEPDPAVRDLYRARRDEFPELYRRDKKWSRRGGAKTKH
jgi:hypothetical protein